MYAFQHGDEPEIVGLGELSDVGRQNVGKKCSGNNVSENNICPAVKMPCT